MSRIVPSLRDQLVARIKAGETCAAIAQEYQQLEGTVRQWMKRDRDTSARPTSTASSTPPPLAEDAPKVDRLRARLEAVEVNLRQCTKLERVSSLAALQSLAARLEVQICDLEELAAAEALRRGLTRGQRELVDSVISKLAAIPSAELDAILAGLEQRRGIGDSNTTA